jgi:hypothetical protein
VMMWALGLAAIIITMIVLGIYLVTGDIKRCPACSATAATPTAREGAAQFYTCKACKTELVSDGGRPLERREHWVPGEPPVPPPTATLRN